MGWVKRNLFLVIFGVIALGLLAYAVMYFMGNRTRNKELDAKLEETKGRLDGIARKNPYPSKTNITVARDELARVRKEISAAQDFFKPIPFEKVADKDFRALLDNTVFDLQEKAKQIGIELPEKDYAFSFKAQKTLLTFAPGSFPKLPEQLAEIKSICDVLFDAKINRLANLKRTRVTVDDPAGSPDYQPAEIQSTTNTLTGTVSNPYEVTFHSFSGELANALQGFYKSPFGLIVKSLAVERAPEVQNPNQPPGGGQPPPRIPPPQQRPPPNPNVPAPAPAPVPVPRAPAPNAAAKGQMLQVILNEKLLKVTLLIEVIKPTK